MTVWFEPAPDSELLTLPELDADSMSPSAAAHYRKYAPALRAVLAGSTVRTAAKTHGVRRGTLDDIVAEARRPHPDGRPVGYRACALRHRRVSDPAPASAPESASAEPRTANTLRGVLKLLPEAGALIDRFKGRLPQRNRPSPPFERFWAKFQKLVQSKAVAWGALDTELGRRAVVRYLRALRSVLPTPDLEADPGERDAGTRQEHLFPLKPMDRIEGDGHHSDVKWYAQVPTRDGGWASRRISGIWLLILIDAVSHAVLAWHLVPGKAYTQFDVLRLAARALTPWRRRNLIVPGLVYHPEAWFPNAVASAEEIQRPLNLALDSAMAHLAKATTTNLGRNQAGIVNVGYPGVPEGRPHVEALFKKAAEHIFRLLAGGFRPASADGDPAIATTGLRPEDYPVLLPALEDLMDVMFSAYNVTSQDPLQLRSPRQVFEQHFDHALGARSTLTARDAEAMTALRLTVTIKGKRDQRAPHVHWLGATYRCDAMSKCYDILNDKFAATVPGNDLRRMALWKDGDLYAVLHAQPPWSASAHDYETRRRAIACHKRGLVSWAGCDDAPAKYHACVQQWANEQQWATDEFVRLGLGVHGEISPPVISAPPTSSPLFNVAPRRRTP